MAEFWFVWTLGCVLVLIIGGIAFHIWLTSPLRAARRESIARNQRRNSPAHLNVRITEVAATTDSRWALLDEDDDDE